MLEKVCVYVQMFVKVLGSHVTLLSHKEKVWIVQGRRTELKVTPEL